MTGILMGPDAAIQNLAIDDAYPIADIDDILPGLIEAETASTTPWGRTTSSMIGSWNG